MKNIFIFGLKMAIFWLKIGLKIVIFLAQKNCFFFGNKNDYIFGEEIVIIFVKDGYMYGQKMVIFFN